MLKIYKTTQYDKWLAKLKDPKFKNALVQRLSRLQNNNFGDCKQIDDDIFELRFFIGPGYRIYFVIQDNILLLFAGVKDTQSADIKKAQAIFKTYNTE
jgi:putative addiction module killer protein